MKADPSKALQRLFDILVKEISLVDRAANKRRFAVIKREHEMENEGEGAPDGATDEAARAAKADEGASDENAEAENPQDTEAIDAGVRALEAVTSAVEALSEGDGAAERLAELGPELSEAVTALFGQLGIERQSPDQDNLAESLRAALGEIRSARERTKQSADDALTEFREALSGLKEVVQNLAKNFEEHTARLSRVEKQFGVPNSGSESRPTKPADGSAKSAWPLDLNTPVTRDNVEKSTSFFD